LNPRDWGAAVVACFSLSINLLICPQCNRQSNSIPVEELTGKSIEEIGNKFNMIQEILFLTLHLL
jgi:hypothetical protein